MIDMMIFGILERLFAKTVYVSYKNENFDFRT